MIEAYKETLEYIIQKDNNEIIFDSNMSEIKEENYNLDITVPQNTEHGEYIVKILSNNTYDEISFNIYEFIELDNIKIKYNSNTINEITLLKNDTITINTNLVPSNSTIISPFLTIESLSKFNSITLEEILGVTLMIYSSI